MSGQDQTHHLPDQFKVFLRQKRFVELADAGRQAARKSTAEVLDS